MKNSKKTITFQIDFIDANNNVINTLFKKFPDFITALNFANNEILISDKYTDCGIYDMYPRSLQK